MYETNHEKGLVDAEAPSDRELLESVVESNSIIAITLMRLYDVLMCQYAEADPEDAAELRKTHEQGQLRAQLPWLNMPT